MTGPVRAADVLAEVFPGDDAYLATHAWDALLAASPSGEPVVLMPDETLARLEAVEEWEGTVTKDGLLVRDDLCRVVPIEEEP